MRVSAYNRLTGGNKSLFGKQGVFYSHLANVIVILYRKALCEHTALLTLLCRLDILIRSKMVHYKGYLFVIKNRFKSVLFELVYSYGRRDIVTQYHIKLRHNELTCSHRFKPCVRRQYLLCHCH